MYSIISDEGKEVTKVKGFKEKTVSFDLLESLLYKNSNPLDLIHKKSFRNLEMGEINIKNQLYTVKATENKRQLVYDKNGLAIKTRPFIINTDKQIK